MMVLCAQEPWLLYRMIGASQSLPLRNVWMFSTVRFELRDPGIVQVHLVLEELREIVNEFHALRSE